MKGKTAIVVCLALLVSATAWGIHEIIPSETFVPPPPADAEALNEYIVLNNPYRAWRLWPGKGRLYEARPPLGLATTFVNDTAYWGIKRKKGLADGAIIVLENYSPATREFLGLFVMYKVKGYNPGAGDWFWAQYDPSGKPVAAGRVKACIDCHQKAKDNDYIFTGRVR
jgi:hypothetical protein